jgi:hypothetical protein
MRGRSQFRGSAGQYYVAYCLTVRNFHAAITLGNVPDVDIVVAKEDGSRLLSIQVKTATWAHRGKRYGYELREWDVGRSSAGRSSENLWYAFVDLQEDDAIQKPLVFIVPSLWVGNFVGIDFSRFMYLLRSELWPDCQERWDHIRGFLDEDPMTLAWARQIPKEAEHWPWPPRVII